MELVTKLTTKKTIRRSNINECVVRQVKKDYSFELHKVTNSCTYMEMNLGLRITKYSSSFLVSAAQRRPWPPTQNPAEFLGGFSTIFLFTV
jgi:hypothetical protein